MTKTAVVLFNLGGPDTLEAVEPFLHNLFSDPAIIGAPAPIRKILARLISKKRTPIAQHIYAEIGNKSPILEETKKQAQALEEKLSRNAASTKVFICMRYWHPMTAQTVSDVKVFDPDKIILLPLYPQFSTTTTGSSFAAWDKEATAQGLGVPTARICCYSTQKHFISAHAKALQKVYFDVSAKGTPRILFSAHGLPEKIIRKGDPYQWQVEQTVASIVSVLSIPKLDYAVCYQSRVGPLKWIGPATNDEIKRAGSDGKPLIIVPVAFVSDHSETLVELDIEYKKLAEENGVPHYFRLPTLGIDDEYIEALAELCLNVARTGKTSSHTNGRMCSESFKQCPCKG